MPTLQLIRSAATGPLCLGSRSTQVERSQGRVGAWMDGSEQSHARTRTEGWKIVEESQPCTDQDVLGRPVFVHRCHLAS
jgi:hypothetical protein